MGTASTMSAIAEGLGMMLPGTSTFAATDPGRMLVAEQTGRRIVALAQDNICPRDIMTTAAFDNAIRLCMALGGSTNAIIHLIAIAGRLGIELPLSRFDELGRTTPCLADLKPSGRFLMNALHSAGGVPAVMKEIESLLSDCLTVTGQTVKQNLQNIECLDREVIRPFSRPMGQEGAVVVLWGNLAPDGAILKTSAATEQLMNHTGEAVVFENYTDMLSRIEQPDLAVTADSVLVLKNCGPKGVPGMPEWGSIPIPSKLQKAGVTDMVRISDSRMSGTSYGTVILHVCPEAAIAGPLSIVQNGDRIRLNVVERKLELILSDNEIANRLSRFAPPANAHLRGYPKLYIEHVLQANRGCDFDFLRPKNAAELEFVPPIVGRS
jgi:dihydroxy-acid dehydratase